MPDEHKQCNDVIVLKTRFDNLENDIREIKMNIKEHLQEHKLINTQDSTKKWQLLLLIIQLFVMGLIAILNFTK